MPVDSTEVLTFKAIFSCKSRTLAKASKTRNSTSKNKSAIKCDLPKATENCVVLERAAIQEGLNHRLLVRRSYIVGIRQQYIDALFEN